MKKKNLDNDSRIPDAVWKMKCFNSTEKILFGILVSFWINNGICFISKKTLQERSGVSEKTISNFWRKIQKDLVLVEINKRPDKKGVVKEFIDPILENFPILLQERIKHQIQIAAKEDNQPTEKMKSDQPVNESNSSEKESPFYDDATAMGDIWKTTEFYHGGKLTDQDYRNLESCAEIIDDWLYKYQDDLPSSSGGNIEYIPTFFKIYIIPSMISDIGKYKKPDVDTNWLKNKESVIDKRLKKYFLKKGIRVDGFS